MTNVELKEYIKEQIEDEEIASEVVILEGDEFADGFIGLTADTYHAVYSYERLLGSLSTQNNWTLAQSVEWLDCNTLRSIPYMPLRKSIIIHEL